jgi:RNA polymerase sigma-70 factor (ECF subfamily)
MNTKYHAIAFGLVGDAIEAEDIVAEAQARVRLATEQGRVRPETAEGYLVTAIKNRAKNHLRKRRWVLESDTAEGLELGSHSNCPAREASLAELGRAIATAMGKLGPKHRPVAHACLVEGKSSDEVAKDMAIPSATVRTRLFHAKTQLQQSLAHYK